LAWKFLPFGEKLYQSGVFIKVGDWYVGQKIVCINTDSTDESPVEPEVIKHLKVGEVYVIRQILDFLYTHNGKKAVFLAFRLSGIKAAQTLDARNKFIEYAFWNGRFQPLEEDTLEVSISETMKNWLKEVVDGTVVFEEEKELEPTE
jgi:hypothetical protein